MSERRDLYRRLAAYGSDLSRWPDARRRSEGGAARDPEFRRAFEDERGLDGTSRSIASARREIAASGAVARLKRSVSARIRRLPRRNGLAARRGSGRSSPACSAARSI